MLIINGLFWWVLNMGYEKGIKVSDDRWHPSTSNLLPSTVSGTTPSLRGDQTDDVVIRAQALKGSGVKLVVIDTPPFATTEVAAIVSAASLVIVPVVPSPHDLRAIGETIDVVESQGKPMVFVVNNASTNGKLTLQAVTALSQHGTVAPSILHSRQDFRSAMIKGRTAGEVFPKGKSASEISELWAYIENRLKKGAV